MAGNGSRSPINISSSSSEESDKEWSSEEIDFDECHDSSSDFNEEFSSEKNDLDEDDDVPLAVKKRKTGMCTESAILTDLNVLDCPICCAILNSPVYQCTNGHIACASCCTTRNKCPSCRLPIGTIRCKAIEKVLKSIKVKCENTLYGCKETFHNKKKKDDHEKTCIYSPCFCPFPKCNYTSLPKSLYTHFGREHPHSKFSLDTMMSISMAAGQTKVFLQDSEHNMLFILNRRKNYKSRGSIVSVTCVAHDSQQRGAFSYDLTVVIDKGKRIKIEADVECMPKKWTHISDNFLALPRKLVKHSAPLKLELIIRRKPSVSG